MYIVGFQILHKLSVHRALDIARMILWLTNDYLDLIDDLVQYTGSFHTDTTAAAIHEHNVYTMDNNQISVRAFQVINVNHKASS